MVYIGLTRSGDVGGDLGKDSLFLTFVYDFVSANGANSFLIDYVDKYGTTGGSNMILQAASIVPFLQSIILLFISKMLLRQTLQNFSLNRLWILPRGD